MNFHPIFVLGHFFLSFQYVSLQAARLTPETSNFNIFILFVLHEYQSNLCVIVIFIFTTDKNETSRFLGEGVSFKAKLIGILEVSEARGDRMCQDALSDLKIAIRAAGEHKQRIIINIAIDGLRLRDEKTGVSNK